MAFTPINLPTVTFSDPPKLQEIANFLANSSDSLVNSGNEFLAELSDLRATDFFSVGDLPLMNSFIWLASLDTAYVRPERPDLSLGNVDYLVSQIAALTTPAAPSLTIPDVDVPDFDKAAPIITLPATPDADTGTAPSNQPNIIDPVIPDAPTVLLPTVPTFEEYALPVPPAYSIPAFSAVAPVNLVTPPTSVFSYVDTGYTSDLRDPLVAKLLDNLTNGGYGIETADEVSLWNRARDRETQAALANIEEVKRQAASTSFPLPQGILYAQVEKARQDLLAKVSDINRDIALKRADLYVENRKFTIQEVQTYEKRAIDLYNAIQERALNAAKATVEMGIMIYDATVKNFNAQLEAYRTEAQVFEARMRAELSKTEIYKAQIEAERLRGQFNEMKVSLYNAQLKGIDTVVQVYRSRLEAANTLAQIQTQKIEAYKASVQAYGERVRAKESEFGAYRAAISGELAKLEVFKAEIDAYNATLSSREIAAKVVLMGDSALLQQYEAEIKKYETQLDSLVKQITANISIAGAEATIYNADVGAYRAYVDAVKAGAEVTIANTRNILDKDKAVLASRVDQVRFRLEQLKATVDNAKGINQYGSEMIRTALGAAMSGINGMSVQTASS